MGKNAVIQSATATALLVLGGPIIKIILASDVNENENIPISSLKNNNNNIIQSQSNIAQNKICDRQRRICYCQNDDLQQRQTVSIELKEATNDLEKATLAIESAETSKAKLDASIELKKATARLEAINYLS